MIKYIFVILIVFLLLASCNLETPESRFNNYDEIVASWMITAWWVPDWLPKSATNIYEKHNIDTNEMFMEFSFSLDDNFYNDCKKLSNENVVYSRYSTDMLKDNNSILFFNCSNDNDVFGVDFESSKAYYWTL